MKKLMFIIISAILLVSCIGAGDISDIKNNGKGYFPSMTGIDLNGKERKLPEAFNNRLNIVTVAFEQKHQEDVSTWIKIADEVITKNPEVGFYEIPLIYEINTPYRFWVNNGMRRGIPSDQARERTITVYTDRDKFKSITTMKLDRIYTLVINQKGKIIWQKEGAVTKESAASLKDFLIDNRV